MGYEWNSFCFFISCEIFFSLSVNILIKSVNVCLGWDLLNIFPVKAMSAFIEVHCDISFVCFYTNPAGTLILTRSQSDFRAFTFIMLSARAMFYNQICECVCVSLWGVRGKGRLTLWSVIDHILLLPILNWL
jgi:hypothetical protein